MSIAMIQGEGVAEARTSLDEGVVDVPITIRTKRSRTVVEAGDVSPGSSQSIIPSELDVQSENNIIVRELLDDALERHHVREEHIPELAFEMAAVLRAHERDPYEARRAYAGTVITRYVRFRDIDVRNMKTPPLQSVREPDPAPDGARVQGRAEDGYSESVDVPVPVKLTVDEHTPLEAPQPVATPEVATQVVETPVEVSLQSHSSDADAHSLVPEIITEHARVMPGSDNGSPVEVATHIVALHGKKPRTAGVSGILNALRTSLPGTSALVSPEEERSDDGIDPDNPPVSIATAEARSEEIQQKAIEEERRFFKDYISEQRAVLEAIAKQNKNSDTTKVMAMLDEMVRAGQAISAQQNISITDRINQIDSLVDAKKREYGPTHSGTAGLQPEEIIRDVLRRATLDVVTDDEKKDAQFRANLRNALEYKVKSLSVEHLRSEVLASLMEEEYVKHKNFYLKKGGA